MNGRVIFGNADTAEQPRLALITGSSVNFHDSIPGLKLSIMADIQSCGFFVYREQPQLSFLLMQHPTRWDLPKGHVDPGETELQCATRELHEETGIEEAQIEIDQEFRYDHDYTVTLAKHDYQPKLKTLTIFLARLVEPRVSIKVTEHEGYKWFDWQPPHDIQARTINPVLGAVEKHFEKLQVGY